MLILTIRTDNPDAEIGLYNNNKQLAYLTWPAHRELAETIHQQIRQLLTSHKSKVSELQAIVVFKGPGSFTGLRIGLSVTNALADSLRIPIVAETSDDWRTKGIARIIDGENEQLAIPEYGSPPHITKPKH